MTAAQAEKEHPAMRILHRERIIALSSLGLGLFILFYLIPAQVEVEISYDLQGLSPAFFPQLAAWLITGLSLLLVLTSRPAASAAETSEAEYQLERDEEFRVLGAVAIAVVYLVAMEFVGFLISTIGALAALMLLQGSVRASRLVIIPVAVSVGVHLFFYYVMKVHFPIGSLFK